MTTAWIDARHEMSNHVLWGLTLLERNVRELEKLGIRDITLLVNSDADPRQHFCQPVSKDIALKSVEIDEKDRWQPLQKSLKNGSTRTLLLEGHAVNDRRILVELLEKPDSCAVISPNGANPAGACVLFSEKAKLFAQQNGTGLTDILRSQIEQKNLQSLNLGDFDPYVKNLRRIISPFLILVENEDHLKSADHYLRQTVHKGTNDLVAKTIHPPLEFGITRLLAKTRIKPNHVTLFGILLSSLTVYLFANGGLLTGTLLAALKGILDGVDGKLARLRLQYSKAGDLLDHVGDTVFDALWYLALGWHFSQGDLSSTAATFTAILFVSYWVERIVPGVFKKLHHYEIYDYAGIDRFMRLIGSRMNNNVWVLLVGILLGFAQETFYFISIWMLATATWHTFRLISVTWSYRGKISQNDE